METAPHSEQFCYNLGYANPSRPTDTWRWQHLVCVNAYRCGQMDAQNQQPHNYDYSRDQYDPSTFERKVPAVEFR